MNNNLAPFTRYRVIYTDAETGRTKSDVTLAGQPPSKGELAGFPVLAFTRQSDGAIHVIGCDMVKAVVTERQDTKYGTWHRVKV